MNFLIIAAAINSTFYRAEDMGASHRNGYPVNGRAYYMPGSSATIRSVPELVRPMTW